MKAQKHEFLNKYYNLHVNFSIRMRKFLTKFVQAINFSLLPSKFSLYFDSGSKSSLCFEILTISLAAGLRARHAWQVTPPCRPSHAGAPNNMVIIMILPCYCGRRESCRWHPNDSENFET
jgi:hypothetical protein